MATKIRKLKDGEGNIIAPVTSTKAVINETGQDVETLLDEKVDFPTLNEKLDEKVDFPTLNEKLNEKVDFPTLNEKLNEKVGFKDAAGNPGIPKLPSIDLSLTDIY